MFCTKCGKKTDGDNAFCPYCGQKISASKEGERAAAKKLVFAGIFAVLGITLLAAIFLTKNKDASASDMSEKSRRQYGRMKHSLCF